MRAFHIMLLLFLAPAASAADRGEQATRFSCIAPRASSVALAGSFNHWDPTRHPLAGPDRDGRWSITVPLAPGRYEYLFLIDRSRWEPDPDTLTADDGMGGRNSIIVIGPK